MELITKPLTPGNFILLSCLRQVSNSELDDDEYCQIMSKEYMNPTVTLRGFLHRVTLPLTFSQ